MTKEPNTTDGERPPRARAASLQEAIKMMSPRWPIIIVATLSVCLLAGTFLARPIVIQHAIDSGLLSRNGRAIAAASVIYGILALSAYFLQAVATYTVALVGQGFVRDLRVRLFSHLQRLSMSFFDTESSGRLVSRMTADMVALTEILSFGAVAVVQALLLLCGTFVILFILSWQLSLVSLLVIPPLVMATTIFRLHSSRAYEAVRDRIADVLIHMQESFAGIRVVQAFARERRNVERFGAINEQNFEANALTARLSSMYIPFVEWLGGAGVGIILYFGGRGLFGQAPSVGTVVAFIFYLNFIIQPIQQLSEVFDRLQSGIAALNKVFGLLTVEPEVREVPDPETLTEPVRGRIDFEAVTFGYAADNHVLHDVNVTIEPGQKVALVGATGAGKSTLAKLSIRFYDPTHGRVLLDGHDLRQLSFENLRRTSVMVPQEGFLFSGTIRDNILFGKPDASDEEIERSCRALGVHGFITSLPDGYETAVSYRGSRLSMGEKQLVSLARAFLADSHVLILDEATASLDPGTALLVESAMRRLLEGRTSIIVAHRLSTAEQADRVLVVDRGRVIEDGHPEDLLQRDGAYAALHRRWALVGSQAEEIG
jgi:ATP-binding cassette, subfamily B, bacterial